MATFTYSPAEFGNAVAANTDGSSLAIAARVEASVGLVYLYE